jgi:hypothetical protein
MFRYGAELDPNHTGFEESIREAGIGFKESIREAGIGFKEVSLWLSAAVGTSRQSRPGQILCSPEQIRRKVLRSHSLRMTQESANAWISPLISESTA